MSFRIYIVAHKPTCLRVMYVLRITKCTTRISNKQDLERLYCCQFGRFIMTNCLRLQARKVRKIMNKQLASCLAYFFYTEGRPSKFLRNIDELAFDYTASQPRNIIS
jgi:hypothetical protein